MPVTWIGEDHVVDGSVRVYATMSCRKLNQFVLLVPVTAEVWRFTTTAILLASCAISKPVVGPVNAPQWR
jgi:hypothetical protein